MGLLAGLNYWSQLETKNHKKAHNTQVFDLSSWSEFSQQMCQTRKPSHSITLQEAQYTELGSKPSQFPHIIQALLLNLYQLEKQLQVIYFREYILPSQHSELNTVKKAK